MYKDRNQKFNVVYIKDQGYAVKMDFYGDICSPFFETEQEAEVLKQRMYDCFSMELNDDALDNHTSVADAEHLIAASKWIDCKYEL